MEEGSNDSASNQNCIVFEPLVETICHAWQESGGSNWGWN